MGHDRLANALKRRAATLDGQGATTRYGTVYSVGPDGTTARITFLPEGNLSPWMPVGCLSIGANAIIAPPNIGDLVAVEPHEGDAENWVITHRVFSTAQPPPSSPATSAHVAPGEFAVLMGDGSYLHFSGGKVYLHGGSDVTITTPTNIVLTAANVTLDAAGNLKTKGEITRGVLAGGIGSVTVGEHHHPFLDSNGDTGTTNGPIFGT